MRACNGTCACCALSWCRLYSKELMGLRRRMEVRSSRLYRAAYRVCCSRVGNDPPQADPYGIISYISSGAAGGSTHVYKAEGAAAAVGVLKPKWVVGS